jgi:dynein regulatory complex protein 1
VEEKVEQLIAELHDHDGEELKVDAVLKALHIRQTEQVNELLEYFTVESEDGTTALINPQEAVRALHAFLDDRRKKQSTTLELAASESTKKDDRDEATKAKQRRKAESEFWERMTRVVPPAHRRVWEALEGGLEKYLAQLQNRSRLIEETDSIRKQNDELRALLNQYLGSKVNEELFSPPQLQAVVGAK